MGLMRLVRGTGFVLLTIVMLLARRIAYRSISGAAGHPWGPVLNALRDLTNDTADLSIHSGSTPSDSVWSMSPGVPSRFVLELIGAISG